MPESQEGVKGNLGGLGGLAGLAGIDLGLGATGSLTPELYPEIVKSVPFQLELIHTPVRFEKLDSLLSSYIYFTEIDGPSLFGFLAEYSIGLPGKIKKLFTSEEVAIPTDREEDLIRLTKEDWKLVEKYRDRISVSVDSKTGIITVITEMPDPYAAASVTDLVVKRLTGEVTDYKIEKAKVNLEFIRERYAEAEKEYEAKQNQVARFTDRNKNITSSLVQTEYQRLQNEMNIAFEVYKGLATQLEQAKIKVKEETPVFTVLEPVKVPVDKSKPKKLLIIVTFGFLGVTSGMVISLIREWKVWH